MSFRLSTSRLNLVERKGLDTIIKILPNVIKKEPNIIYFIIGRGPEKENLVNTVKKLKLRDKIKFIGYVSDQDLANYYSICDIFLLMSRTIKEKAGLEKERGIVKSKDKGEVKSKKTL